MYKASNVKENPSFLKKTLNPMIFIQQMKTKRKIRREGSKVI
jgi:hypothetical protein